MAFKSVCDLLERRTKESPDRAALMFGDEIVTYEELNSRANQLAHYLKRITKKGDFVAVAIERSIEMVVAILAILKSGNAYVPFDLSYPPIRLEYMLLDSEVNVILTMQETIINSINKNCAVVFLDTDWENIARESRENLSIEISESDLMYMMYTSGSTGNPKGVMIRHASCANYISWFNQNYKVDAKDVFLQKTTVTFDLSVWELFCPLTAGARLVIAEPNVHKDPILLYNTLVDHNVTIVGFVPSQIKMLLSINVDNLGNVRLIISGGEVLTKDLYELVKLRFGLEIKNSYGPTEATINATFLDTWANRNTIYAPLGKPISNVTVYILDKNMNQCDTEIPGEIHIGGMGLARGYWKQDNLTIKKFVTNSFGKKEKLYKTGDLGKFLPDGNIEYLGRIDDQVKIHGFRIELEDIAKNLNKINYISEHIVLTRKLNDGDASLIAYIVPREINCPQGCEFISQTGEKIIFYAGYEVEQKIRQLKHDLGTLLPEYMIPASFVLLNKLPLMQNGKIDGAILLKMYSKKKLSANATNSENSLEGDLCHILADILNIEAIGKKDNFFQMGCDSVSIAIFVKRINDKFIGAQINIVDIIADYCIENLIIRISNNIAKHILREE